MNFDDFLNETYGPVEIGELTYEVSEVLKKVDPIAYREMELEFEDMMEDDD